MDVLKLAVANGVKLFDRVDIMGKVARICFYLNWLFTKFVFWCT